jgi:hypothetical protein
MEMKMSEGELLVMALGGDPAEAWELFEPAPVAPAPALVLVEA